MKTNYFNLRQISLYSILGFFGLAVTSCSSYQNTSSYDSDGVYGSVPRDSNNEPVYTYNDGNVTEYNDGTNSGQNMNYKAYFQSLQNEYPAYTDTDGYTSYDNDTIVQVESYGGWGEETDDVTVNIYGGYGYGGYGWNNWYSPYWAYSGWGWGPGWSVGIGWGSGWGYGGWGWGLGWNSWYSPYYYGGWGYPYYGYYGYPHYHYGNNYGRSTAVYSGGRADYYNRGRYATGRRNVATSVNSRRQNAATVNGRRYNTSRSATVRSRGEATYSEGRTRSTRSSDFSNSSRTRSNNTFTPSRSSSPSRSSGTFSSPTRSSGGSFGGGRSSGGGGGSRGGGRRG